MHFSKTYAQILLGLPPELRENAIEYRQLKKLINQIVTELTSLGLSPDVLQDLLHNAPVEGQAGRLATVKGKERAFGERPVDLKSLTNVQWLHESGSRRTGDDGRPTPVKAVYELVRDGDRVEPRLRIWIGGSDVRADSTARVLEVDDDLSSLHVDEEQGSASPAESDGVDGRVGMENATCVPIHEVRIDEEPLWEASHDISKHMAKEPGISLVYSLQRPSRSRASSRSSSDCRDASGIWPSSTVDEISTVRRVSDLTHTQAYQEYGEVREIIIPLLSDSAFFQLLNSALTSLSAHFQVMHNDFTNNLDDLARRISRTARPQSSTSRFKPHSSSTDPSSVSAPLISPFSTSFIHGSRRDSDLYTWREIFQLYVESEVFESMSERDRGERSVEDAEERLASYARRITERGLNNQKKLKSSESRKALEAFLELNVLILNLKKFHTANVEAARKILKKHTKRTALPLPDVSSNANTVSVSRSISDGRWQRESVLEILAIMPGTLPSFPHMLVQAVGVILLPIIPHIDDYECLICTSIAFKPIRLACGHLFCVRCLVKMQKRGKGNCPICRAETVLRADKSNVDWALLNFMQDWFPQESKAKLKQNEEEASKELMEELGLDKNQCVIC